MPRPARCVRPALRALVGALLSTALLSLAAPADAAPSDGRDRGRAGFTRPAKIQVKKQQVASVKTAKAQRPGAPASASARVTAADGSTVSLIPAPPAGPTKSVWEVSYYGFCDAPCDTSTDGYKAQLAFQAAVDIWARIVTSSVPIKVNATFAPLDPYVLGSASACAGYYNGIGDGQTIYPSPLADAIKGADQSALYSGAPDCDIDALFSSDPSAGFYYGTDGLPPLDKVDFESVVLHELGHGLGFGGSFQVSAGLGSRSSRPYTFDRYAYDALTGGSPLLAEISGTTLASKLQNGTNAWGGPSGVSASGGVRPHLYAPSVWEDGSSFSHLDESTYGYGDPDSLMTPYIAPQEAVHTPGVIAVGMFNDLGWTASMPAAVAPTAAPSAVTAGYGNARSTVSWAAAVNAGTVSAYTVTSSPGGLTCSTTTLSCTVTGLTNGQPYTFTVQATNSAGAGPASAPVSRTPDGTAPSVASVSPAPVSLANPVLAFSGTDAGSGIASYDVYYQTAPWNGSFPTSYKRVTTAATTLSVPVSSGTSLCFYVVSRDKAGNTSGSSARRCTVKPLDDRSLARSSGWGSLGSSSYYATTATSIAKSGATLTRTGASTKRIYLVASTSSTAGTVGIYWNGKLLKQISLRTTAGNRRVFLAYDLGSAQAGTLVLKAMNGSRVTIDAVGFGRF